MDAPNSANEKTSSLTLDLTERELEKAKAAADWLRGTPWSGDEAAKQFSSILDQTLANLCQDIAERLATGSNLPRIDEEASLAFSRPAYRHTFTTAKSGKRRRRQAGGVWIILYPLPGDGTLQVLTIRHGAAEPLTAFLNPTDDSASNE